MLFILLQSRQLAIPESSTEGFKLFIPEGVLREVQLCGDSSAEGCSQVSNTPKTQSAVHQPVRQERRITYGILQSTEKS